MAAVQTVTPPQRAPSPKSDYGNGSDGGTFAYDDAAAPRSRTTMSVKAKVMKKPASAEEGLLRGVMFFHHRSSSNWC
jgi:hypothetical protein